MVRAGSAGCSGAGFSIAVFAEGATAYTDHSAMSASLHHFHVALDQVAGSDVTGAFGWDETFIDGFGILRMFLGRF